MFNFWENIVRYPRFFISTIIGLVLIITTPLQSLLKSNQGKIIFTLGFFILSIALSLVFKNMLDL